MHADIDERTERGHIADHTFEHHARFEVLDVLDALGELRRLELGPRIAAGFFQLLEDVAHRRHTELVVGEHLRLQATQKTAVAQQCLDRLAGAAHDALDHRIRFRMHRRHVQRLVAIGNAQETGALLEGLVAQPRHLEQVLATLERAIVVAVTHDIFRYRARQPGHARQQRRRGGIDVHTDRVDAVLHPRFQCLGQPVLIHIVLVLAHADRLGLDLHQFGQWILQTARDRHGTTQRYIQIRKFLGRELRGRIHRCARLAHHHLL